MVFETVSGNAKSDRPKPLRCHKTGYSPHRVRSCPAPISARYIAPCRRLTHTAAHRQPHEMRRNLCHDDCYPDSRCVRMSQPARQAVEKAQESALTRLLTLTERTSSANHKVQSGMRDHSRSSALVEPRTVEGRGRISLGEKNRRSSSFFPSTARRP